MSIERLTESFIKYVAVDSETHNELAFCELLERELKELGFQTRREEIGKFLHSNGFNLYGYLDGVGESILLCCHTDTVTPGKGITAVERDGIIRSEGNTILGADDKSGIAEITEAVRRLQESNTEHRPIEVLFTLCEEIGMLGSKYTDYTNIRSRNALVLDGEEVGEVVNSAAANIVMSFHFYGKPAHAGICPEEGIHALKAAVRAANNIPVGHLDSISVANISNFLAPGKTNIVAEKAEFDMEFRSFDEKTIQMHIDNAISHVKEACKFYGARYAFESERHSEAVCVDPECDFIKNVFSAYKRAGIEPRLGKTLGGCDASNLAAAGIDVVNIGTGMSAVHTTDEFIKTQDMESCVRFLCELLKA